MVASDVHPWNKYEAMVVTLSGMFISLNVRQFLKAVDPIVFTCLGRIILFNEEQPSNADLPMVVKL